MSYAVISPFAQSDVVYLLGNGVIYKRFQFIEDRLSGCIRCFQSFDEVWLSVVKLCYRTDILYGFLPGYGLPGFLICDSHGFTDSDILGSVVVRNLQKHVATSLAAQLQYVAMYYVNYTICPPVCQHFFVKK